MSSTTGASLFLRVSAVALALFLAFISLPALTHADTPVAISNAGFETGTGNNADGWTESTFGTANVVYTMANGAPNVHSGTRAGNVKVNSISAGSEAKWLSPAVAVTAGQVLNFSDYYKSDVLTSVFIYGNDNSVQWIGDAATSSAAFTQFVGQTYIVPTGVTSIQIGHSIYVPGTLTTDDYALSLVTSPTQFAQGYVTLSFDDGWDTFAQNAQPILDAKGIKSTNYIITGPEGSNVGSATPNSGYMTAAQVVGLKNAGYDIQDHTKSHVDLAKDAFAPTYASRTAMWQEEINNSITALQSLLGTTVDSFAYPFGSYCAPTLTDCSQADVKSYVAAIPGLLGARSVDEGYNLLTTDKFALKQQHIVNASMPAGAGFSVDKVKGWIDYAVQNHVWLILMFHDVRPTLAACVDRDTAAPDIDCTDTATLQGIVDYLSDTTKVPAGTVKTMHQVLTTGYTATTTPPVVPVIAAHADVSVATSSSTGEFVTYTNPTVTPTGTVTCAPASGTLFAIGSTTVSCTSTGAATTTFVVAVTQTVIPVIASHADVSVATTSASGEFVTYTNPTVTAAGTVTCAPASGTLFALGSTTVSCTSTGAATTTFVVGVAQTQTPVTDPTCSATQTLVNHVCVENQTSGGGSVLPPFTSAQCWDGIDNDGDGKVDYPADNSCSDRGDNTEGEDGGSGGGGGGGGVFVPFIPGGSTGGSTGGGAVLGTSTSNGAGSSSTATCYLFTKTLGLGVTNADVTALQNLLVTGGFYSGPVTGYFGSLTKGGVMKFQTAKGISAVGTVGPLTRAALNACGSSSNSGTVLGASSFTFTLTLGQGSSGNEVTELQNRLTKETAYSGPITGFFGSLTKAAVIAYQALKGISPTGVVGPLTRAALNK